MNGRRSSPQGPGQAVHDAITRTLSAVMIVIGVLLIVRGAALAIVVGVGMIVAGAGRLWVVAQRRRSR